jgi:hypothetical protein
MLLFKLVLYVEEVQHISVVSFRATFTLEASFLCIECHCLPKRALHPVDQLACHLLQNPPVCAPINSKYPNLVSLSVSESGGIKVSTEICTGRTKLREPGILCASLSTF